MPFTWSYDNRTRVRRLEGAVLTQRVRRLVAVARPPKSSQFVQPWSPRSKPSKNRAHGEAILLRDSECEFSVRRSD